MQLRGQETLTLPAEKGPSLLLVLEGGAQIDYDVTEEVRANGAALGLGLMVGERLQGKKSKQTMTVQAGHVLFASANKSKTGRVCLQHCPPRWLLYL